MQEKDKINFIQQDLQYQKRQLKNLTERMNKEDVRVIKQIQGLRDINDRLFNHIFDIYSNLFLLNSVMLFIVSIIFGIKSEMRTGRECTLYIVLSIVFLALGIYSFYQYAKCKKSKKQ